MQSMGMCHPAQSSAAAPPRVALTQGRAVGGVCLCFCRVLLFLCGVFPSGAGEVWGSSQSHESLLGLSATGVRWESRSRMGRGCPGWGSAGQ